MANIENLLTPIEKYVIDNDLDENGNSISGSIHAGFTASLLADNETEAQKYIDATAFLFKTLATEMRQEYGSDRHNISYGFDEVIFKDNAMKIYNYCKFLTVAMDTKIAKAIVDKRKELEVHNAC